jgi:hypothetical protein
LTNPYFPPQYKLLLVKNVVTKSIRAVLGVAFLSLFLLPATAQECLNAPAGLVGWWSGDNHLLDLAGSPNHASAYGVNFATGKVNSAFQFYKATAGGAYGGGSPGSSIKVPLATELNVRGLTFAAWINPATEDYSPIVMYQRDGDFMGALFWTGYWPGVVPQGTLYANLRQNSSQNAVIQAPGVIFTNRWTFVAVTYEPTNGVARLIVNDQVVKEENVGLLAPDTAAPLYIGHCPTTTLDQLGGRSFDGGLDEVQVFNRALTTAELNQIYRAGSAGLCKTEIPVILQQATATFSQTEAGDFSISKAVDGVTSDNLGWAIAREFRDQTAVFETVSELGFAGGTSLKFNLLFNHISFGDTGHTLGKFRLSVTTDPRATFADGLPVNGDVSANWIPLAVTSATSEKGATLTILPDQSILVSGTHERVDTYAVTTATRLTGITGIRLEALQDPSLPVNGPGREVNGNFVLSELYLSARPGGGPIITNQPASTNITLGSAASFRVAVSSSLPVAYQWFRNGAALPAATNSTHTIENAAFTDAGTYTVQIDNAEGAALSSGAILNVLPADIANAATLLISNKKPTNAPVSDVVSNLLSGPRYLAQAYIGASADALQRVGPAVPFLTGEDAGFFAQMDLILTNLNPGAAAFVQVKVWDSTGGPTYEDAVLNGAQRGASSVLAASTGGGAIPTPRLDGLTPFSLVAPPKILSQPASREIYVGSDVRFEVQTSGSAPLSYQWFVNGNAIRGATSSALLLTNAQVEQRGSYHVVVTNPLGSATSSVATLTVNIPDTTPPVITITSPAPGATFEERVTLSGSITDNVSVASATWELNGQPGGDLLLENGRFTVTNIFLARGLHIFRVTAVDTSTNSSSQTFSVTNVASRVFFIGEVPPHQEGARVRVPLLLSSRGEVGGLTFALTFNNSVLTEPEIEWSELLRGGIAQASTSNFPGTIRGSFALSGTTLPTGAVHFATVTFRSRSIPVDTTTPLRPTLLGLFGANGNTLSPTATDIRSSSVRITRRKFIGDNNANDRLDIGDASTIMRFANFVEQPRIWDGPANDLNGNSQLDAGDVIRVLRAVVGLDPQPSLPPAQALGSFSLESSPDAPRVALQIDQPTAAPGEQVKVTVNLSQFSGPISGASFRLNYPAAALRLENATAHRTGALVPSSAAVIWNLSPAQNDYAAQDGAISLAVISDRNWPASQGTLAELTFTVQAQATNQARWPISLLQPELSSGYDLIAAAPAEISFLGREPRALTFDGAPALTNGTFSVSLNAEAGVTYRIEVSENLADWAPLATLTASGSTLNITDSLAGQNSRRFYRAVQVN